MTIDQDNDGVYSEQDLYDKLGAAFDGVHLGGEPGAAISRGRTLRRRKLAVPALAATGILAASLSLAAVTQPSATPNQATAGHSLGYDGAAVNVDNAAFSVHTDAKTGVITLTVRQLFDQSELQKIFAEAGIQSVFHSETPAPDSKIITPCTWLGARTLDDSKVVSHRPIGGSAMAVFVINPAEMPTGSVLAFQYITMNNHAVVRGVAVALELLSNQPTGCKDAS